MAMGASLAFIWASLWIKEFEPALRKQNPKVCKTMENQNGSCPECRKKIPNRQKSFECKNRLHWLHQKSSELQEKILGI